MTSHGFLLPSKRSTKCDGMLIHPVEFDVPTDSKVRVGLPERATSVSPSQ